MSSSLEVKTHNVIENKNVVLPHQRILFYTPLTACI